MSALWILDMSGMLTLYSSAKSFSFSPEDLLLLMSLTWLSVSLALGCFMPGLLAWGHGIPTLYALFCFWVPGFRWFGLQQGLLLHECIIKLLSGSTPVVITTMTRITLKSPRSLIPTTPYPSCCLPVQGQHSSGPLLSTLAHIFSISCSDSGGIGLYRDRPLDLDITSFRYELRRFLNCSSKVLLLLSSWLVRAKSYAHLAMEKCLSVAMYLGLVLGGGIFLGAHSARMILRIFQIRVSAGNEWVYAG